MVFVQMLFGVQVFVCGVMQDVVYWMMCCFGSVDWLIGKFVSKVLFVYVYVVFVGVFVLLFDLFDEVVYLVFMVVDQVVIVIGVWCEFVFVKGMVNVVLCCFLCECDVFVVVMQDDLVVCWNYCVWWVDVVKCVWFDVWQVIFVAGECQGLLMLCVNVCCVNVDVYFDMLCVSGIEVVVIGWYVVWFVLVLLVDCILGFVDGVVLVQDVGVQFVVEWFGVCDGMCVFDVCVVFGGKIGYIFEFVDVEVVVFESDVMCVVCIGENFVCLLFVVNVCVGDVGVLDVWYDGCLFDCILVDVLCLVFGIVWWYFDICWLCCEVDILVLVVEQCCILLVLWLFVKLGGELFYVICLIFFEEGEGQVCWFEVVCEDVV